MEKNNKEKGKLDKELLDQVSGGFGADLEPEPFGAAIAERKLPTWKELTENDPILPGADPPVDAFHSAEQAVDAWMNSDQHRDSVSPDFEARSSWPFK
jgi:hypothetical protein